MSKKRASRDAGPKQLLLPLGDSDSQSIRAGQLCRKEAVREALTLALAHCDLSREDVASEMSRLTGEAISVNHIHNWSSGAKRDWRFPMEYATAFCIVTGDWSVVAAILDGSGMVLADEETVTLAQFGGLLAEEKKRQKQKKALMEKLGL